jgi:hypothetical protein
MSTKTCPACGAEIVYCGRGRPRRYCEACTPPGSSTGVWFDAWLAEHRDEIEAERRREHAEFMARMGELRRNRLRQSARGEALSVQRRMPSERTS